MKKKKGFTLAEILITLAIIGIVAAITLPSLLVNVNEKAWDAQKRALHARLAQAIGQMNTLGGYGTFETDDDGAATTDTAAESFILDALSKVYKINNVCGPDKLSSCSLPSKITTFDGAKELNFPSKMSELNSNLLNGSHMANEDGNVADTKAAAFETVNGESIAVYYNPLCSSDTSTTHYAQNKMCVNFVYDLNGSEGPNQVGKDVGFITALYNRNPSVVAPILYPKSAGSAQIDSASEDKPNASGLCKTQSEGLRLPDRDEAASIFINATLLNMPSDAIWTGSIISVGTNGRAWYQHLGTGGRLQNGRTVSYKVQCIQK